ncbi:MAG: type II secretion system F family protein [Neisseria sp.]|nr:type II secretion system F family protein [Neisseria sp.]
MFGRREKLFAYEGRNRFGGEAVKGKISARNAAAAREKLKRRGILVQRLEGGRTSSRRRPNQVDVTVFTRQFSAMVKAGVPLVQALDIAARGQNNAALAEVVQRVRGEVEQGRPLSQAFAEYPEWFDRFYCNLIAAGEAGGVLETLLDRLAEYKEKTQTLQKNALAALTYPAAVLLMAVLVLIVMMVYILPAFAAVYADMGAQLPWFTRLLMNLSSGFAAYGWWGAAFAVLAATGIWRLYRVSPAFRRRCDAWRLGAPLFGSIVAKTVAARWARTTATMFAAGIPLPDVLESVAAAAGSVCYEEATLEVLCAVNQGSSLAFAMRQTEIFPDILVQMAEIGGETGALDEMLDKAAQFYEEDADAAVARLSGLASPLIVLVLGGIIGVFLVGMYLPLFDLGNALG